MNGALGVISPVTRTCKTTMRITVRLSDDLGEDVKRRTDNVSRYVEEALIEKIQREERRRARQEILGMAGGESVDPDLHDQNQQMRQNEDWHGAAQFEEQ
jgi:post-segregation antitoxin (ccd killing protein)